MISVHPMNLTHVLIMRYVWLLEWQDFTSVLTVRRIVFCYDIFSSSTNFATGIEDGESCYGFVDEDFDDILENVRDRLSDVANREIVSRLNQVLIPCQEGHVCRRETLDRRVCRPENQSGQCVTIYNNSQLY